MNWDRIEGNWKQFTGKAREQWGKLTDNDWSVVAGKKDQLVGKIQERYGIRRDEAAIIMSHRHSNDLLGPYLTSMLGVTRRGL